MREPGPLPWLVSLATARFPSSPRCAGSNGLRLGNTPPTPVLTPAHAEGPAQCHKPQSAGQGLILIPRSPRWACKAAVGGWGRGAPPAKVTEEGRREEGFESRPGGH